jgi:hypothetical protein
MNMLPITYQQRYSNSSEYLGVLPGFTPYRHEDGSWCAELVVNLSFDICNSVTELNVEVFEQRFYEEDGMREVLVWWALITNFTPPQAAMIAVALTSDTVRKPEAVSAAEKLYTQLLLSRPDFTVRFPELVQSYRTGVKFDK